MLKSFEKVCSNQWIFKMSVDDYMKSVMLVSINFPHDWTNVRFFKCVEDATLFANCLNIQGKIIT